MACKLIYNHIEFDTEEQIAAYLKEPNIIDVSMSRGYFGTLQYIQEAAHATPFERRLAHILEVKSREMASSGYDYFGVELLPEFDDKDTVALARIIRSQEGNSVIWHRQISFSKARRESANHKTFLHEALHLVTILELTHNRESAEPFEKLLSQVKEEVNLLIAQGKASEDLKDLYENTNAFEDVHELVSWGLTDVSMQSILKSIEVPKELRPKNFWDIFIDFLLDLLGLNANDKTALSQLVIEFNKLIGGITSRDIIRPDTTYTAKLSEKYVSDELRKESNSLTRDDTTSSYKDSSTKLSLDSVTGKVIPLFQERTFDPNYNAGEADADRLWKNTPKNVPQKTWLSGDKEMTYAEHVAAVNQNRERFIARAELYHLIFHKYFTNDPSASTQIAALMSQHNISDSEIDWLTTRVNGVTPIQTILENRTGTDFWQKDGKDKIITELAIKSDVLGWAGRVDLAIDHGNNILSFFDIKTGYGISKEFQNYLLKYGNGEGQVIWDNPLNRAKLQLMLYAVIAKSQRPELKFRNLKVLHIPSEFDKHLDSMHNIVDVKAFLKVIETFLEKERPKDLARLLEKSPKIFDSAEYNSVTWDSISDKLSKDSDPAMELQLKILELQNLIMYDKSIVDKVVEGKKAKSDRAVKIKKLMTDIIALKGDKSISYAAWDTDMGWLDTWLGSASYSTNPYVQLYYKILTEQKQKARTKYQTWREKFDGLLKKALNEAGLGSATKLVGGPKRDALFSKLLVEDVHGETSEVRIVTDKDEKWGTLSKTEQNLANFINDSVGYFFDDNLTDYVDPRTGKKTALANKVATYITKKGVETPITNLQLHNREMRRFGSARNDKGKPRRFEYKRGFFPKHAPQLADIAREHGGYLSKGVLQFLWNKYSTNYYEVVFDQWNNTMEAIPMKYLGGPMIDHSKNFSLNVELAIDSFVKQHFYKQYLDEVYTFGQAMQIYLAAKPGADSDKNLANTIAWFEDSVNLHILGKKDISNDWLTRKIKRNTVKGWEQFNFTKFLRSLRSFFSAATMWLKPVTGIANYIFASLVTMKEAVKNQFFIQGPHSNFDLGDLASGFATALGMQKDAMLGKLRTNKAYLLMEKFGYLPDNYDWYTQPNQLMTSRNKLFTSRSMTFFHTAPEEVISTAIFVAQMKRAGLWDHYKEHKGTLSTGEEYISYEWDGTVRGKIDVSNIEGHPVYQDITEPTSEEINAMKFLYEKIHGGYRLDERVRAEYYVMGELMLQFKKFLPGTLKNVGASRGYRNTQGFYKEVINEDGTKILKWTPQVVEGRWRLIAGLIMNYLHLRQAKSPQGEIGSKVAEGLRVYPDHSYDWSDLSETQKEDVIDLMLTMAMWALLFAGYSAAWDRDDQDALKKVYARIMNDVNLQANPVEVIQNAINLGRFVTINKFAKLLNSGTDVFISSLYYTLGDEEQAFTEQGNLRGIKEFERNIPLLSAYHDWVKNLNESPDLQDLLDQRYK